MSSPALIVMAAGIGSRYGGLKQIEPVGPNDEIILDYSVYDALKSGVSKIFFVINRNVEQVFRSRIERSIGKHCETNYVFQDLDDLPAGFKVPHGRAKPWGTAHAVLSCRKVVHTPFVVINADDFYGRTAYESLAGYLQRTKPVTSGYDFCMVGYRLEKTLTEHGTVSRGICSVDRDNLLIEIRERTHIQRFGDTIKYRGEEGSWIDIPANSVASMNIWGFTPDMFLELETRFTKFLTKSESSQLTEEYFLPEVINQLLVEGKAAVQVLPTPDHWFGVTYPQDVEWVRTEVRRLIAKGVYPADLWG